MKTKMLAYNEKNDLFRQGDKIVVGVSGGRDSVCLIHLLNEIKEEYDLTLMVVHINHGIRGRAARRDAKFVERLAQSMNLPCHVEEADVRGIAKVKRISEEEAGRMVRYDTMEMIRMENQFDKIAIAHHQDDVAETVLFNLLRGTGPKGLSGISPKRDYIIRPILFAQSEEIKEYIDNNQLSFVEDYTNAETKYTRNKIRLKVFPYFEKEINKRAKSHVAEAATRIALQNEYIEKEAKKAYLSVVRMDGNEYIYEVKEFEKLEPVIRVEVLRLILQNLIDNAKDIDGGHYRMIGELSQKEVGKLVNLPEGVVAWRTYDEVRLAREEHLEERESAGEICIPCEPPCTQEIVLGGERVKVSFSLITPQGKIDEIPQKDYTKWFDYDKIKDTILLRNPMAGDFLSIDEEGNRKKLSRYFIDNKVPSEERTSEIVIADGNHIIWVLSGRISEAYKVTPETEKILVVTKERISYERQN